MTHKTAARLCAALALAATGAVLSAQSQPLLPSYPKKAFGASISPAYDGWYNNADGSHSFLIGYYNRNWGSEIDVPIGPNNHFEPGDADRGQPTHFLPNRNWGMFTITVPRNTPATEKIYWVLTVNGVTQRVSFHMSPDFNITTYQSSEESPGGKYNKPPVMRFAANAAPIQNPIATIATAIQRTATAGSPMPLDLWVEDDGLYSSGTNAPMRQAVKMVDLAINKYRGPGTVTMGRGHQNLTTVKGGTPGEPYAGTASTTASFSEPGNYMLHVTANDLSGPGGGNSACCWTTALVSVAVKGGAPSATGGQ